MSEIGARLDALRAMFGDEGFLQNKGLSNEVGLYIFAYPPEEEMAVRAFVRDIRAEYTGEQSQCRVMIYDLYDILLDICRERRILDRIGQMEKQRGQAFMREQIQRIAPPQAYVDKMKYAPHRAGDVVIIGGVGRVYPYMRSHNVLNNLQHVFDDVPVVLLYPGEYSGQSLTLFGEFEDDNYYRAFNIVKG